MASKVENWKRSQHLWWSRNLGWLFRFVGVLGLGAMLGRLMPELKKVPDNVLVFCITALLFIGWLLYREEMQPEPEDDEE